MYIRILTRLTLCLVSLCLINPLSGMQLTQNSFDQELLLPDEIWEMIIAQTPLEKRSLLMKTCTQLRRLAAIYNINSVLRYPSFIFSQNLELDNALRCAVKHKCTHAIEKLIICGADRWIIDSGLLCAIQKNDIDATLALLAAGADPNFTITFNGVWKTPFKKILADPGQCKLFFKQVSLVWIASMHGHTNVVHALIDAGAHINEQENFNIWNYCSPLNYFAEIGDLSSLQKLLTVGANINGMRRIKTCSPLCRAKQNGHEKVVELLVNNGAWPYCRGCKQYTYY